MVSSYHNFRAATSVSGILRCLQHHECAKRTFVISVGDEVTGTVDAVEVCCLSSQWKGAY